MASNAGVLVAFVLAPPLPWQLLPRGVSTAWAGSSASLISNTSLVMAAGDDDSQGVMGFDPRTLPESVLNGLKEYSFRVELHAKEALKVRFCFPQLLYYSVIASPYEGKRGFYFLVSQGRTVKPQFVLLLRHRRAASPGLHRLRD